MQRNLIFTWLGTISFAGVLIVNALALFQPLNGLTTSQVSDLYPNLFTPSGITFSIWSVIYFLLVGFLVLAWQRHDSLTIEKILPWFTLSCVLNMTWIVAWHFLFPFFSVLIMICLLAVLSRIFLLLYTDDYVERWESILVVLPFTIYLAWICVATIANFTALFVHWDWAGGETSQVSWTVVMMAVAAFLSVFFMWRYRSWSFSLVILWALFGICLRWESGEYPVIVFAAIFLIMGQIAFLVYRVFRSQHSNASV